jgi:hypothetical protein
MGTVPGSGFSPAASQKMAGQIEKETIGIASDFMKFHTIGYKRILSLMLILFTSSNLPIG